MYLAAKAEFSSAIDWVGSRLADGSAADRGKFTGRSIVGVVALSLVAALGAVTMIAGLHDIRSVIQLGPGLAPMQFNTALCFFLSGMALLLRNVFRQFTVFAGILVGSLALATSLQYLTGLDFGLDTLVVTSDITDRTSHVGRMSIGTASAFMFTGIAITLSSLRLPRSVRPPMLEFLALLLFAAACEGGLSHTIMIEATTLWPLFYGMAVQTSFGFFCLALALIDMSWTTQRHHGADAPSRWALSGAFAAATMFDLLSPVGVIGGIAYLPVIFLADRSGSSGATIRTAALATSFAVLGFAWSPQHGADLQHSLFNRFGEIAAIWTVALLLCRVSRQTDDLRKSEQRYTLAVEAAKVGLWDRHLDGTDNYWWSPVMYRLFGYHPGEIQPSRKTFAERLHPEDRWTVKSAYLEHLIRRAPYEVEMRLRHRTLGYRWYLCAGQAVWSQSGRPVRMTGTLIDIDDRKRAERQRSETEWVATVSHELRTPMTSCLGALSIARSGRYGVLPEPVLRLLDMAYANGGRLVSLVDDLLTTQKLNAGHFEMNIEVCAAHQLLDEAQKSVSGAAIARDVNFETEFCVGNPRIRVDPARFIQAIVNFLSNAVKYGPQSGRVRIATEWIDNSLRISVSDQGPGIPEEDCDRIFQKFFRVESEAHRQVGGTGLGLSISKSIIDSLGGRIGFESAAGEGATFYVEFPIVTWAEAETADPPARRADDITPEKIRAAGGM